MTVSEGYPCTLCVCACVHLRTCTCIFVNMSASVYDTEHMWRSEDNLWYWLSLSIIGSLVYLYIPWVSWPMTLHRFSCFCLPSFGRNTLITMLWCLASCDPNSVPHTFTASLFSCLSNLPQALMDWRGSFLPPMLPQDSWVIGTVLPCSQPWGWLTQTSTNRVGSIVMPWQGGYMACSPECCSWWVSGTAFPLLWP